ncbi:MAG: LapA family protein [Pseudomonadota bacterium]|uniref:LapA family protein n=1 Tax=Gallaecimonas pentaromativorans TaxID=584787 RepID=UPI00067E760F|nr:LapA family protein [Gallaecimonas pentaromativorans]MED5525535.1 LapA family protein [Pseudomonadota bacterium]
MLTLIKWLIAVVIFILALAVGAENAQPVAVNYLVAQKTFSLGQWLGIAFAFGALLAFIVLGSLCWVQKRRIALLQRKLSAKQKDA